MRRCYEIDKGRISQLALSLINRLNDGLYNARSCLGLLSEFAIFLWRNKEPDGANSRENWLKEIWLAFSKSPNAQPLIFQFIAYLAINCSTQPAVFFGILNDAMLENPYIYSVRAVVFTEVAVAANAMSRLAKEGFPFWPKLAQDWLEYKLLNDRLARLGLLNRRSFAGPTPTKKNANTPPKKSRKALLKAERRFRHKHRKIESGRSSISPGGNGNCGAG